MTNVAATVENAIAMHKAGRAAEAEALCREVLRQDPGNFNALHLAGVIALQNGAPQRAVDLIGAALRAYSDMPQAYNNLAAALIHLKDYDAALRNCDHALALNPQFPGAYNNRGTALRGLKRPAEALQAYDQAAALRPDDPEILNNRGVALSELGRNREAEDNYARAVALRPNYPPAHHNRGTNLRQLHRHAEALACFARVTALDPNYGDSHWEAALTRLQIGDFANGWSGYEWRWQAPTLGVTMRGFAQPQWRGDEALGGETILAHSEQGLGDTIQFCRYAALLADKGARVILEVQKPLVDLLTGLAGVAAIVAQGEVLPAFDLHCPMMSLPLAFKTNIDTIPAPSAYLHAPPEKIDRWRTMLGEKSRPRIALAWSGNPAHRDDHNRSIPLRDFVAMLPGGYDYISLQTDLRPGDDAVLRTRPDIRCPAIGGFTDTAALCALADVVLTVDTSIAHVAGGLGRPVWILLPFTPDWRWLLERTDSPWYPSATLYRQPAAGDWKSVFTQVHGDLEQRFSP